MVKVTPKKDRYAEHDLDISMQLNEMNAYVNDFSSKLDLKPSQSAPLEKKKLKLNLGKIGSTSKEIEELKKENKRLLDRQAKEIQ
jgi:hypothetical protein